MNIENLYCNSSSVKYNTSCINSIENNIDNNFISFFNKYYSEKVFSTNLLNQTQFMNNNITGNDTESVGDSYLSSNLLYTFLKSSNICWEIENLETSLKTGLDYKINTINCSMIDKINYTSINEIDTDLIFRYVNPFVYTLFPIYLFALCFSIYWSLLNCINYQFCGIKYFNYTVETRKSSFFNSKIIIIGLLSIISIALGSLTIYFGLTYISNINTVVFLLGYNNLFDLYKSYNIDCYSNPDAYFVNDNINTGGGNEDTIDNRESSDENNISLLNLRRSLQISSNSVDTINNSSDSNADMSNLDKCLYYSQKSIDFKSNNTSNNLSYLNSYYYNNKYRFIVDKETTYNDLYNLHLDYNHYIKIIKDYVNSQNNNILLYCDTNSNSCEDSNSAVILQNIEDTVNNIKELYNDKTNAINEEELTRFSQLTKELSSFKFGDEDTTNSVYLLLTYFQNSLELTTHSLSESIETAIHENLDSKVKMYHSIQEEISILNSSYTNLKELDTYILVIKVLIYLLIAMFMIKIIVICFSLKCLKVVIYYFKIINEEISISDIKDKFFEESQYRISENDSIHNEIDKEIKKKNDNDSCNSDSSSNSDESDKENKFNNALLRLKTRALIRKEKDNNCKLQPINIIQNDNSEIKHSSDISSNNNIDDNDNDNDDKDKDGNNEQNYNCDKNDDSKNDIDKNKVTVNNDSTSQKHPNETDIIKKHKKKKKKKIILDSNNNDNNGDNKDNKDSPKNKNIINIKETNRNTHTSFEEAQKLKLKKILKEFYHIKSNYKHTIPKRKSLNISLNIIFIISAYSLLLSLFFLIFSIFLFELVVTINTNFLHQHNLNNIHWIPNANLLQKCFDYTLIKNNKLEDPSGYYEVLSFTDLKKDYTTKYVNSYSELSLINSDSSLTNTNNNQELQDYIKKRFTNLENYVNYINKKKASDNENTKIADYSNKLESLYSSLIEIFPNTQKTILTSFKPLISNSTLTKIYDFDYHCSNLRESNFISFVYIIDKITSVSFIISILLSIYALVLLVIGIFYALLIFNIQTKYEVAKTKKNNLLKDTLEQREDLFFKNYHSYIDNEDKTYLGLEVEEQKESKEEEECKKDGRKSEFSKVINRFKTIKGKSIVNKNQIDYKNTQTPKINNEENTINNGITTHNKKTIIDFIENLENDFKARKEEENS